MEATRDEIVIRYRYLLSLYLIIPVILIIVATDILFLNKQLLHEFVPSHPGQWAIWTIIFNIPHIVASWVTFVEKEYINHYRVHFTRILPLFIIMTYILHFVIGGEIAFVVLATFTMYHVLSQQFGLTLMMLKGKPGKTFRLWKWSSIIGALFIYSIVHGQQYYNDYSSVDPNLQLYAKFLGVIFILASIPYAYQLMKASQSRIGVWYLWANVAMVTACLIVVSYNYYAFVIIIPRVIHDITAFIVYAIHDNNRNKDKPVNILYRLTSFTHLPPWVLCPVIAMLIAYPLAHSSNNVIVFITITLIYFHYYFESFIWRGNSLHRQRVSFIP